MRISALFVLAPAVAVLSGCAASGPARPPRAPAPAPSSPAPPSSDAVEQGVRLYEQGRYDEAQATLAPVKGVRARAYLAASEVRLERYSEAEAAALEALQANPAHAVASAALGEALVAQGRLQEAIQRLSAVIEADARLPYAHYWRAQAYHRTGQIARMVDDYRAFLRLVPDAPEAPAVKALLASLE